MTMEYIITFANTNAAIKSEQLLLAAKLHVAVMPLPSQIRAGCGICLRLSPEEIGCALVILTEKNIGDTGLYARVENSNHYVYSEVMDRSRLELI